MPDDLTKLTVNLTQRSVDALYAAAEVTELSKTDVVNRALQMYAVMCDIGARANGQRMRFDVDLLGDDGLYEVTVANG